jgi:hypothetical protein
MTNDDKQFPFQTGDKVRTERRIVDRVVSIDSFTGDEIVELKERFETALLWNGCQQFVKHTIL